MSGSITIYAGLSGALSDPDEPKLEVKILPALGLVSVSKIVLADKYDATGLGEMIAGLLNKFRDNIAGEINRSSISTVTIPTMAKSLDQLDRTFKINSPDASATVQLKGEPVSVPARIAGIAWLVTEKQLISLVQLLPLDGTSLKPSVQIGPTYREIQDQVESLIENLFAIPDADRRTWVAIRKDLVASTLNSLVAQANACIVITGESYKEKTSSKIELPNGGQISCDSDRDCRSNRGCDFIASEDHRDCSTCILPRPRICSPRVCAFGGCVGGGCSGGGCAQMGRDPVCALAQGVQNDIYRADAAAKKLDCERLKATEKLTCEGEKAGEKALCEVGKEALNRLAATGKFANLDVESSMKARHVQVCLRNFSISPAIDNVRFSLEVTGTAGADVDLKFVPLDIVGHLTCQFPWTESKHIEAALRESVAISSKIRVVENKDKAQANFAINEMVIKARLSPSPTEFLLSITNMTLSCAGLSLVKPLVVVLTPFIPALRGDIDHKLKAQNASFDLRLPSQKLGNRPVDVSIRETAQSFVAFAKLGLEVAPAK